MKRRCSLGDEKLIHGYDPKRHQVLCGIPEQTSSTKHAERVTCPACRKVLDRERPKAEAAQDAAPRGR